MRAVTQTELDDIAKVATSTDATVIDNLGILYSGKYLNAVKEKQEEETVILDAIVDIMAHIAAIKYPQATTEEILNRAIVAITS